VQETVPGDRRKAPKLRVLIVDDDARVRRALRSLIGCSADLTVVGEAGSTRSAKRLDLELLPDVVVLDLLLPQAPEGMQVLRELRGRDRPVVAISRMGELGPPKRWWQARTRSWRSTAGMSTTSST
jgi:chemotaxis response regulator CheB